MGAPSLAASWCASPALAVRGGRTVGDAKLLGGLLHDGRNVGQVHVADLGEEVVLNLVVEATAQEGQQPLPVPKLEVVRN